LSAVAVLLFHDRFQNEGGVDAKTGSRSYAHIGRLLCGSRCGRDHSPFHGRHRQLGVILMKFNVEGLMGRIGYLDDVIASIAGL
jgi:hypothetical protein